MKKLLLFLTSVLWPLASAFADTPIKDLKVMGSNSQIASGAFAVKSGVTVTFESGSTLDVAAATVKVGTLTSGTNANVVLDPNGTGVIQLLAKTYVGTAATAPTAFLHLIAGTATAGTAPLKLTSGPLLTAPEAGALEYDGSWVYYTNSTPTRKRLSTEANAAAIASTAIDWSLSSSFTKTLGANTTFTFSNATDGQTIVVAITNTASNYTVTWPTISWFGTTSPSTAPVQSTGANTDVYTFIKVGSTIYGNASQALRPGFINYSPTWTSAGTQPVLGNGTLTGEYYVSGDLVTYTIELTAGSTTTFGTGNYSLGLPTAAVAGAKTWLANVDLLDTGTQHYLGTATVASGSATTEIFVMSNAVGPTNWGPTNPFTFGNGDKMTISGSYRK